MTDFRCGPHVTGHINRLLGSDPSSLSPAGRAALAKLRQASAHEPGTVPDVWAFTVEGVPEGLPPATRDRVETAVHVALTLFAIHQQARGTSMHDPMVPLGRAVRRLGQAEATDADLHETPLYRRFTAMVLAETMTGLVTHARGIVTQLRAHDLGFDYGRFADDLYWFQHPAHRPDARRRWGRDFHHLTTPSDASDTTSEGDS